MAALPTIRRTSLEVTLPPSRTRLGPVPLLLLALTLGGLGLAVVGRPPTTPAASPPAHLGTATTDLPRGDLPIIGDPIRDLTLWYSGRVSDANRAGIDNLRGRFLAPIDPIADPVTGDLYGKILLITIPLLALGGIILGYLVMLSRTTGESAYTARAVTPRFIVGATLSILGIFFVSVMAQFVIATDLAMVGVAMPQDAVGGADTWPASGGVFMVLQNGGFDPRVGEGPNNWNSGAWLSAGLLAAILTTFLQMMNAVLSALERLLVIVGPICLAAYALPATQRVTNVWLKVLGAILLVRFAWTIVFHARARLTGRTASVRQRADPPPRLDRARGVGWRHPWRPRQPCLGRRATLVVAVAATTQNDGRSVASAHRAPVEVREDDRSRLRVPRRPTGRPNQQGGPAGCDQEDACVGDTERALGASGVSTLLRRDDRQRSPIASRSVGGCHWSRRLGEIDELVVRELLLVSHEREAVVAEAPD